MIEAAVAWAADQAGPVVASRTLAGGTTSTMLALDHADGTASVLRLIDREPWRTHGADLATRESETQAALCASSVLAPRTLALDAAGRACGVAGHLMTLLPGAVDLQRVADADLHVLAETLATIHDFEPTVPARPFQSWAWEAKYVVPAWAERPAAWEQAFDLLRRPAPDGERVFLHRDFQPRNVLWEGGAVTGVVDWVETSTGPPWLDVAHCATNLAIHHSTERAAAFAAAYTRVTGRTGDASWEVMDVVGFLPPPGRAPFSTDPAHLHRLEEQLVAALSRS